MRLNIESRVLLKKWTLLFGYKYHDDFLTPKDVYLLRLSSEHEYDWKEIVSLFSDHIIIGHHDDIYVPFTIQEREDAKQEYIDSHLNEGVLDITGINYRYPIDPDIFKEYINEVFPDINIKFPDDHNEK